MLFAVKIHRDLRNLVSQFFMPPLPDPRSGGLGASSTPPTVANTASIQTEGMDVEELETAEATDSSEGTDEVMQHTIEAHIAGLKSVETNEEAEVDNSINSETQDINAAECSDDENASLDDTLQGTDAFKQFKVLIQDTESLREILTESYKLMSMLTLGCDKGSIAIGSKFKSRSERWFGSKKSLEKDKKDGQPGSDDLTRLRRNSIIVLRVRKGGQEMLLEYRALAFFIKYYNKWFVSIPNEFLWNENDKSKIAKGRVLARLVKKHGETYEEVQLETGGEWAPNHVFVSVPFDEIVSVGDELVDM